MSGNYLTKTVTSRLDSSCFNSNIILQDVTPFMVHGRTIQEPIEIARDVAKKILEAKQTREGEPPLPPASDEFDYPLIVNA